MEVAASVESMDTTSPPASPIATENNLNDDQSKNDESDDSTNHSSSENSNGPVENNNEGSSSESNKNKRNAVTPEDSQCSNSKESSDSQEKSVPETEANEKASRAKAKESLIGASDNESKNNTNDECSDDDSNEGIGSSDEGSEDGSDEPTKEAVSVNSDSEPETVDDDSRDDQSETENGDVVMIENPTEVHEIVSDDDDDDCVVTNEDGAKSINGGSIMDNDSDIEETAEDPLNHNDNKMNKNTSKSMNKSVPAQNGSSVVIIDTDSILSGKGAIPLEPTKVNSSTSTAIQSAHENIGIRGIIGDCTVKSNATTTTSCQVQTQNAPLLPTLTDDMFVVEAPSFIVPYVYEKPSIKAFREFVDVLGKELDEQRAKEEKELLEKEKEEKEKRQKEKEERRAKGEQVEDSEEEIVNESKEGNKEENILDTQPEEIETKQKVIKKKRGAPNDEDDASWDGESDVDSEEQVSEDDELTTVVIKDKEETNIEEIKTIATNMQTADAKPASTGTESFFDNNLGKFFMNIGLNLVQEYVQTDLLKQQKHKLRKEKKCQKPRTKIIESAIGYLTKNLEFSREQNAPYKFKQKNCNFCFFRTESALIMAHHLETPHMKNNIYTCNFCSFEVRSPHDILFHMEAEHNTRSRLERAPAYHQCANCPFEDNGKGKLARHLIACAKKFKPDVNLAPPIDWEPPAKIPKLTRARVSLVAAYNRSQGAAPLGRPPTISGTPPMLGRPRGPAVGAARGSMITGAPLIRGGVMMRHTTPAPMHPLNFPIAQNTPGGKIVHQPSISITPLPRTPQPQLPPPASRTQGSFVICEICDGYIKDLEQLRSHMQWIHKVKIHPKMIYNRPPLNCQKCQFRFFTDQGLERHLLGSHGLVTSSMQETANQGKDSGRCPVCGRVYQWKLLNHVAKDHNMTLKPAHLSYKCTVCTATFGMYKLFESHVYTMHSAVGKKMADNKTSAVRTVGNSSITIVPAGKTGASKV